jgi:hypothetical protein
MRQYPLRYFVTSLALSALLVAANGSSSQHNTNQQKPLSPKAQSLKQALEALQANPDNVNVQKRYLEKFPKDFASFMKLFAPTDFSQLYDGAEYIFILRELIPNHPIAVGEMLVGLGKDARWDADAPSYLQMVTAEFAASETPTFVKILRRYPGRDVSALVRYLADAEDHAVCKEYSLITKNLRQLGEEELAKLFEQAKSERMKRKDH